MVPSSVDFTPEICDPRKRRTLRLRLRSRDQIVSEIARHALLLFASLATAAVLPSVAGAEFDPFELESITPSHARLVFEPGVLVEVPFTRLSLLTVRYLSAGDTLERTFPDLGFVGRIYSNAPPGTAQYRFEGPWSIISINSTQAKSQQQIVQDLEADPIIDTAQFDPILTFLEDDPTLGQGHTSWYPPELARSLDGSTLGSFSYWGGQFGFHFPSPSSEPQFLFSLADSLALNVYESNANLALPYPRDLDMPQAWGITRGSSDVVVAVIDVGVDWLHRDFYDADPPSGWSYEQHMLSSNAPRVYRNYNEVLGDGGDTGASGLAGIDDDGDGWIDEDPTGLIPTNEPEPDVIRGTVASVSGDRIYAELDSTEMWTPGDLVGLQFGHLPDSPYWTETITANGPDWVETTLYAPGEFGYIGWLIDTHGPAVGWYGWEAFLSSQTPFTISDLRDTDGDKVVDDDWAYDPTDDDENGIADDFRGAAFLPPVSGSSSSVLGTNDQRPIMRHGTSVASQLAADASDGGVGMVGVAPEITFVPIRFTGDVTSIPEFHASLARCIDYALDLKNPDGSRAVDIITMAAGYTERMTAIPAEWLCASFLRTDSSGYYLDPLAAALERAMDADVLVVNAAGNKDTIVEHNFFTSCFDDIVIVGGHLGTGVPSRNMPGNDLESTFYPGVDLLAWSVNVPSAVTCNVVANEPCLQLFDLQYPSGIVLWEDGTSLAAPQVAGVAALMLSANPSLETSELRAKLLASTGPITFFSSQDSVQLAGKVGSGILNAFRALTIYGPVSSTVPDTTWANTVWVSGDLLVPAGKSLVIEPGTTVKIGRDDILDAGNESRLIEWLIDGSLTAIGTPSEPIVFEVFGDPSETPDFNPDQEWAGIRMLASENVVLENVIIHDLRSTPRDSVTNVAALITSPGEERLVTWTSVHETTNPTVRVRTSPDGGDTFDTGTTTAVTAGSLAWTAPSVGAGTEVVIRVEFVDANGYVLGFDDLAVTMLEVFGFTNVSDATGLTVPFGSEPYASAPLDFDGDEDEDLLVSFETFFASLNLNSGGTLSEAPVFNNVALAQLHDGQLENTRGIAVADFIGDGSVDVFIADADTTSPSNLLLAGSSTGLDLDESFRLNAAASLMSIGASFGDFDGDGWLDLYVLSDSTGTGDLLMRLDPSDTTFVDATSLAGLRTGMINSTSVAWADVNLDGRLDLVVGWGAATGSNGEWSPLYINQGPDTSGQVIFADKADPAGTPWIDTVGHVQATVFADITGDRRIDLIVATDDPSAQNTLLAFINDGTGTFALADSSLGIQSQVPLGDVAVSDFDGNGVLDVIAVPKTTTDIRVFSGHGDMDHRVFLDRSLFADLGSEIARGVTLADFNRDTDADIFLLREELSATPNPEDKRFFWSNNLVDATSAPSTPKAITIGFARESGPNNHNTMGIGARVSVEVTPPGGTVLRSVQVVDGGRGRGSQGSSRLVFGLAGASNAQITVRWPHGQTQVFDAASFSTFPHITLTDTSDPEIQSSTVSATYVPSSGNTAHTYTWKSNFPGGTPQVLLTAGARPTECLVPLGGVTQILLDPSMPEVNTTSTFANDEWTHTLTWATYCTDSCTYTYYARNVVGGQVYSSTPKTLNVSVCADIME